MASNGKRAYITAAAGINHRHKIHCEDPVTRDCAPVK